MLSTSRSSTRRTRSRMAALAGSRLASILPTLLALSFAPQRRHRQPGQGDQDGVQGAGSRLRRERGHAARLDLPVERRMEVPEGLVVRAVPGLRRVAAW